MANSSVISFVRSAHGNVTILIGLMLPVLFVLIAGALELTSYSSAEAQMQGTVDEAAVYGAKQATLANARRGEIEEAVKDYVKKEIGESYDEELYKMKIDVNLTDLTVRATLGKTVDGMLMKNLIHKDGYVEVASKAVVEGTAKLCAIGLETKGSGVVQLEAGARLVAPECSIYSNSVHRNGLSASGASEIDAQFICTAGGADGGPRNYSVRPVTDCPEYPDPFESRQGPTVPNRCDENDFTVGLVESRLKGLTSGGDLSLNVDLENLNADVLQGTNHRIRPGVYCGGITVGAGAILRLDPGIYILRDGQLRVDALGQLDGENVSFYLVGEKSTFHFGLESKISLTAPKSGKMAGVLFMEDKASSRQRTHSIMSNDARMLLGTFYLPNGVLSVDTILPIADESAYTVIIARMIQLAGSPTLVLNTDYGSTDIPVPAGVGPVGGQIRVIE